MAAPTAAGVAVVASAGDCDSTAGDDDGPDGVSAQAVTTVAAATRARPDNDRWMRCMMYLRERENR
jgi:hypothetical protein